MQVLTRIILTAVVFACGWYFGSEWQFRKRWRRYVEAQYPIDDESEPSP